MLSLLNLKLNHLGLQLKPVAIREFIFLDKAPCLVYKYYRGGFHLIWQPDDSITREQLKNFIEKGHKELFVRYSDYELISGTWKNSLLQTTRSLSVGNPLKKGIQQLNLLSLSLQNLYHHPLEDGNLTQQFQGVKNFGHFLLENPELIKTFYHELANYKYHYTLLQPMLASLALIGYFKKLKMFSDDDLVKFFITSYFKDIGMSLVPNEKYAIKSLNSTDRELFDRHPFNSVNILQNRIPLSKEQLFLIENHHRLTSPQFKQENKDAIYGMETTFTSVIDIIVAMTQDRPYRARTNLFDSLQHAKNILDDSFQQEFKLLVYFFRDFFE